MGVKPLLKWAGGKGAHLSHINSVLPKEINNYIEPFVGGGSVLLNLCERVENGDIKLKGNIYAWDVNPHLITMYQNIQNHPHDLCAELEQLYHMYNSIHTMKVQSKDERTPESIEEAKLSKEAYYYWCRHQFNNKMNSNDSVSPALSALLMFLNKTCWRGVYREGPRGFNVPFGNYKKLCLETDNILRVSSLIRNVNFSIASFDDALNKLLQMGSISDGDVIYMDPPYYPENKTSFVDYVKNGFSIEKHNILFDMSHTLRNIGATVIVSNSNVNQVLDRFVDGWDIINIRCKRFINSKDPSKESTELLIVSNLCAG